jgi:hypothetical protein
MITIFSNFRAEDFSSKEKSNLYAFAAMTKANNNGNLDYEAIKDNGLFISDDKVKLEYLGATFLGRADLVDVQSSTETDNKGISYNQRESYTDGNTASGGAKPDIPGGELSIGISGNQSKTTTSGNTISIGGSSTTKGRRYIYRATIVYHYRLTFSKRSFMDEDDEITNFSIRSRVHISSEYSLDQLK